MLLQNITLFIVGTPPVRFTDRRLLIFQAGQKREENRLGKVSDTQIHSIHFSGPWQLLFSGQIFCRYQSNWQREGIVREFGIDMYTLLYLKRITKKDLLYSTGNSAQCYVAARMGAESGGEWIHVYIWLTPFAVRLKLSQHC